MQVKIQNLFNFVCDRIGKDSSVVGLCGINSKQEILFTNIPKEFKKAYIPNLQNNYLLY